jgi:hypothetical protein
LDPPETQPQLSTGLAEIVSNPSFMKAFLARSYPILQFAENKALPKFDLFFDFDCYDAIREELFTVFASRPIHVLRHHHPRLS